MDQSSAPRGHPVSSKKGAGLSEAGEIKCCLGGGAPELTATAMRFRGGVVSSVWGSVMVIERASWEGSWYRRSGYE